MGKKKVHPRKSRKKPQPTKNPQASIGAVVADIVRSIRDKKWGPHLNKKSARNHSTKKQKS